MPTKSRRPVVLCILDGWGHRAERTDNAIALAATPAYDTLMSKCPHALLETSGAEVGLPAGQMGNSEVGHTNIGAGRVVLQDLPRIDAAIADGTLAQAPALADLIAALKASGGRCHLIGLVSPGGVHSHQDQMAALARIVAGAGVPVAVHAFLDGRDTPPRSAGDHMRRFMESIDGTDGITMATVTGRYWAMDRDTRWPRVERAYNAIVSADGRTAADAHAAIASAYQAGTSDEFVEPTVIDGYGGANDCDGLLMANFRADRVREIVSALADPGFEGFARTPVTRAPVKWAAACGMVEYSQALNAHLTALFAPVELANTLGEVVDRAGLRQLRIAETEKYAHVTFFFNGGEERVFPGEERILVPSPKVATYDLKPEMSAAEVTDRLIAAIEAATFDLIIANYANPDMVGHSGQLDAAIKAIETVDTCLGRLHTAVDRAGGVLVIIADHGNAERMRDPASGDAHTAHTTGAVPLIVAGDDSVPALRAGRLADVAPTVLHLLGLAQPKEMTGRCLIGGGSADDAGEPQTVAHG